MNQETGETKLNRPLISGEVLLCEEENYQGQQQLITANTSSLDFSIASLQIGPKIGVTVFSDENHGGISQELTAELPSFQESRLKGNPKSIKIWSAPGKPFTGYWAIGVAEEDTSENVEKVYLRVGPDGVLTSSAKVSEREQFRITDGFTGWASSSYLKQVTPVPPPPPGGKYRATAGRVHLREGPGTGFRSLGYIQVNETVTDLGVNDSGTWRQVLRHDGQRGWVSARYFTLLQSAPSDPGEAIPQDATRKWYRATAKLNVREGAGTSFKAIGSLQGKEIVEALEANADGSWLRIRRTQDPAEAALGRRRVTFSVSDPIAGQTVTSQPGSLTLDDFRNLTMVNEQEAGFRKFSLLSQDNQWIHYNPEEKHFLKSADAKDRTIFCQSIKIAKDETQVGELSQGEVALFENVAYWGKTWVFHTSYADFSSIPGLDEAISSIQLGPLAGATIYRGAQFSDEDNKTAGKQDVTTNLPSLLTEQIGENRISSIGIWQIVDPASLKVSFECRLSQDFHGSGGTFEEYSAYRTILRLPPTVETVEIWATDATTIDVDGKPYSIDETEPVELPNPMRGMVITTDASGDSGPSLRTPGLKIRTKTMKPHERIMIFPDQKLHADLANLEAEKGQDALWNATYGTDKNGNPQYVVAHPDDPDKLSQQQKNSSEAQAMITRVMSTVNYSQDSSSGWQQTVSPPDDLASKSWVLHLVTTTYMVTAETLYVREGPGVKFRSFEYLVKNDIVEPLEFNTDASWVRVRRLKDGLTGWSSSAYIKTGERFRVTASKLHVREQPGTESPSLGYLQFNEIVTGIGVDDTGGWRKIRRSDGTITGWCAVPYLALIPPPPPSPVSAAPSAVMFQTVSQEQVQALLGAAESPDTNLAQGWDWSFTEMVNAVKNAVSVAVTKFKDGLAFIIEQVDKAIAWIVNTAEQVVAFVQGIFEKIGAAIANVIKWLQYVFDWGDILKTRDQLHNLINVGLDQACQLVTNEQVPIQVRSFFDSQKEILGKQLEETIRRLRGPAGESDVSASAQPDESSTEMRDAVEWIMSKLTGGGLGDFALATGSSNAQLSVFWGQTVETGLGKLGEVPDAVGSLVGTLLRDPDKPLKVVADLLELVEKLATNLLDAGEVILLGKDESGVHTPGLIDVVPFLIDRINAVLNANICIPFITDICEWIRNSGLLDLLGMPHLLDWMGNDPGNLGFSLLDAISLVLAIPITVIYKARYAQSPFENIPSLPQELADFGEQFLKVTAGVCGILNSGFSAVGNLGVKGPLAKFAEVGGFITSLIAWLSSIYERVKQAALMEWYLFSIEASQLLVSWRSLTNSQFKDDLADKVTGCIGGWHMIMQIWNTCEQSDEERGGALLNLVMILPEPLCLVKARWPESRLFAIFDGLAALAAGASIFV